MDAIVAFVQALIDAISASGDVATIFDFINNYDYTAIVDFFKGILASLGIAL